MTAGGRRTAPGGRVLAGVGGCTLYDDGLPNGTNGYSNGTAGVFGARRTLLDDFVVPPDQEWWIEDFHWHHIWNVLPPGSGQGLELTLWSDAGGQPGQPLQSLVVTGYSEVGTGQTFFSREKAVSWAILDPVLLASGHYWFEATIVGPENNFWLTADQQNNECWVNYDDLGGLQPGSVIFGVPSDISWCLSGVAHPLEAGACCVPGASCMDLTQAECEKLGGEFAGAGFTCDVVGGCPGACCLGGGACFDEIEALCAKGNGDFLGEGTSCAETDCRGACCLPEGECLLDVRDLCTEKGGDFQGVGTTCETGSCVFPGRVLGHQKISDTQGGFTGDLDPGDQFGAALAGLGDLDGDGKGDLAVGANLDDDQQPLPGTSNFGAVWILFLDGVADVVFDQPQEFIAVGSANFQAVGNLDAALGPGAPTRDVVVLVPGAPGGPGQAQVFLNQGEDPFGEWQGLVANEPVETDQQPSSVDVGLFNPDPFLDFAVANADADNVFLYVNDRSGLGTFLPPSIISTGDDPRALATADYDGDGDDDLAVAYAGDEQIFILFNDGGVFTPGPAIGGGMVMSAMDPGDLDNDKDLDIVHANSGEDTVGIEFLQNGAFQSSQTLGVGANPVDVTGGDFDLNGFQDIATADHDDGRCDLLTANTDPDQQTGGSVTALLSLDPLAACGGDLDGDGVVGFSDILAILAAWGPCPPEGECPEDLDGDGLVGFSDLLFVLAGWGPCT